jgi:hypothetical protein
MCMIRSRATQSAEAGADFLRHANINLAPRQISGRGWSLFLPADTAAVADNPARLVELETASNDDQARKRVGLWRRVGAMFV